MIRRLTEADVAAMRRKVGGATTRRGAADSEHSKVSTITPAPRYRSKLEEAFAYRLVLEKRVGDILQWWHEPANLRLPGEKNFYKCDFLTQRPNGHLTFYEIKGRNKSDDRSLVKIKTAAGVHTWAQFVLVKRIHGQWDERTIT